MEMKVSLVSVSAIYSLIVGSGMPCCEALDMLGMRLARAASLSCLVEQLLLVVWWSGGRIVGGGEFLTAGLHCNLVAGDAGPPGHPPSFQLHVPLSRNRERETHGGREGGRGKVAAHSHALFSR